MINEITKLQNNYDVIGVYGLFSGGHDSLTACHVASQHPAFSGIIHIDTTTGPKETQEFVRETCAAHGWPLIIKRPYWNFESLIARRGFPGPGKHRETYDKLKDRTLRHVLKDIKKESGTENRKAKIILISGVRQQESDRRAEINAQPHEEGVRLWYPIISGFTATDCTNYIKDNGLKRSPVKDLLHMSGECFCGCFARETEYHELGAWYPYQAERIRYWQSLVDLVAKNRRKEIELGLAPPEEAIKEKYCRWGWGRGLSTEQTSMPMCFECRQMSGEAVTE